MTPVASLKELLIRLFGIYQHFSDNNLIDCFLFIVTRSYSTIEERVTARSLHCRLFELPTHLRRDFIVRVLRDTAILDDSDYDSDID